MTNIEKLFIVKQAVNWGGLVNRGLTGLGRSAAEEGGMLNRFANPGSRIGRLFMGNKNIDMAHDIRGMATDLPYRQLGGNIASRLGVGAGIGAVAAGGMAGIGNTAAVGYHNLLADEDENHPVYSRFRALTGGRPRYSSESYFAPAFMQNGEKSRFDMF